MTNTSVILMLVIAALSVLVAYLFGVNRAAKISSPVAALPSDLQVATEKAVTEILLAAEAKKAEIVKLAEQDRSAALQSLKDTITAESDRLDNPEELTDYLLQLGKEIRNGG